MTVFLGGVIGYENLAQPDIAQILRAAQIGIYEHGIAQTAAVRDGSAPAISAQFPTPWPSEAELGYAPNGGAGYFANYYKPTYVAQGFRPTEANVNVNFDFQGGVPGVISTIGSTNLPGWQSYVDAARLYGIKTVAPVFSPNLGIDPLTNFATDPIYAGVREAALYGGALAIDSPPAFHVRGPAYDSFVQGEIRWALGNGLRVTDIISPHSAPTTFLADTKAYIAKLEAADALPTEWVVENYRFDQPSVTIDDGSNPNSLTSVALFVTTQPIASLPEPSTASLLLAPLVAAFMRVRQLVLRGQRSGSA